MKPHKKKWIKNDRKKVELKIKEEEEILKKNILKNQQQFMRKKIIVDAN